MWFEFLLMTIVAIGPMAWELRRLYTKYGIVFSIAVGGSAVVGVGIWLLAILLIILQMARSFSSLELFSLLAIFIIPLLVFSFARRRYSTAPSLLPAAGTFLVVAFFIFIIAASLGYAPEGY
jgi:hypothetical protein